jgi:hypothetical protein
VSPRFKTEPALCCINIVIVFSELIFVPIALAAYFRQPVLFGLTPLTALVFAYFPRRFGRVVKVAFCLRFHLPGDSCYVGNDGLNAKNSYSPFFDQVRDQLRDRELYTTLLDDRRLPLIEFYLDRHVPIIRDDEKLFQLLKSSAKVSVIPHHRTYERLKKSFDLIPHQLITPSSEKQPLFW